MASLPFGELAAESTQLRVPRRGVYQTSGPVRSTPSSRTMAASTGHRSRGRLGLRFRQQRRWTSPLLLAPLLASCATPAPKRDEIVVFAAASLTDGLRELSAPAERE